MQYKDKVAKRKNATSPSDMFNEAQDTSVCETLSTAVYLKWFLHHRFNFVSHSYSIY